MPLQSGQLKLLSSRRESEQHSNSSRVLLPEQAPLWGLSWGWPQLPGENHDGHLGSPNSTNKLIFDSPMSCCAQATCLPFSISLIISRGGYIFAKLHLKGLAPSPHRFSLSVPVGDLSAVLHSPPSKFLPALVICTYGEHMSQAKNKISEVM